MFICCILYFFTNMLWIYLLNTVKGSKYDTQSDKHLFFWMFEKRSNSLIPGSEAKKQDKHRDIHLVVWLTGGPGC